MHWSKTREKLYKQTGLTSSLAQHWHSVHSALPSRCLWRAHRSPQTALLLLGPWLGSHRAKEKHWSIAHEQRQEPWFLFSWRVFSATFSISQPTSWRCTTWQFHLEFWAPSIPQISSSSFFITLMQSQENVIYLTGSFGGSKTQMLTIWRL